MENKINPNCSCPIVKCKRHGDCQACAANHPRVKPYCKRPDDSLGKRVTDKIFGGKNSNLD